MDVIFETSTKRFLMEVGFFDTVKEMKEKIEKYEGFPVALQTLVFNGAVMADDRDTMFYQLLQGSRINLLLHPSITNDQDKFRSDIQPSSFSSRAQIVVKIPFSKRQLSLEVDTGDTAMQLKQKLFKMEGIPATHSVIFFGMVELADGSRTLGSYGMSDGSEVTVAVRALPGTSSSSELTKRIQVNVISHVGMQHRVQLEVNASDNVSELRKELQRLNERRGFPLPGEGVFFFIHEQKVMEENRTFRWHDVRPGDTIDLFKGSVITGGSY